MPLLTHNELRITQRTISLKRLPSSFDGLKLVQLSDLHFYEYSDKGYYQRVMDEVNALKPDVIAMTGDVVHYGPNHIELAASFLSQLVPGPAKLAILGNHDYNDGMHSYSIHRMLTEIGFTVLKNSSHSLEREGQRLWFAGLDDLWYGKPDLYQALDNVLAHKDSGSSATIVMAHNPLLFDPLALAAPVPVDLVLAGHTHAGHVYIPFLGPIYRRVFRMKYRYGLYEKQGCQLHVSSGVGSAAFYLKKHKIGFPRFRFNTYPEIAVLTLVCG